MDLVDADGRMALVGGSAALGQRLYFRHRSHDAGRVRPQLRGAGKGVGLQRQQPAVRIQQFELVEITDGRMGQEDLPHPRLMAQAHRMAAAIPAIEAADHAGPPRVRRPDGEADAGHITVLYRMGAQHRVGARMAAGSQQVQVFIGELRSEGVSIGIDALAAIGPAHGQAVLEAIAAPRNSRLKEARLALREGHHRLASGQHTDRLGARQKCPQPQAPCPVGMQTQDGERIRVAGTQQRVEVGLLQHRSQPKLLTDQTRSTYSAIVRSDENQPMPATFNTA